MIVTFLSFPGVMVTKHTSSFFKMIITLTFTDCSNKIQCAAMLYVRSRAIIEFNFSSTKSILVNV